VMIAGTHLGICTDASGITRAVHGDKSRGLVRLDDDSAISIGASGVTYFAPLDATSWPELAIAYARPMLAAAADRTTVYAIDQNGTLMRRSASWSWVQLTSGFRAIEPIAMWVGQGVLRVVSADGSVTTGTRQG
jgi:hypothetical protein